MGIQSLGIDGIAWGRGHRPLILDWFRAKGQLPSGVVEGFNGKAKLATRKAYGFRTYHGLKVTFYHALGALPEPRFTHRVLTRHKPLLIGYRAGRGGALG